MSSKVGIRIFILITLLGLIFVSAGVLKEYSHEDQVRKKITVEVKPGTSFYELSIELQNKGVVRSAYILRKKAEKEGVDKALKPGKYEFFTGASEDDVLRIIKKGPVVEVVKVTFPEGFSNREIAKRLSAVFGFNEAEVLKYLNSSKKKYEGRFPFLASVPTDSLEGYLFPDTYYFKKEATIDEVVEKMLENFLKKAMETGLLKSKTDYRKDLHEIITLASIVEKEAKLPEERPLVASVFINRIKKGMKLQSCATVEYILGFSKPKLTEKDLQIDSPYNTYLYSGLPPGPICNPGRDSILAALKPAKTKYLYFVLVGENGKHYFAETYSEFLKAKQGKVR